MSTADGHISIGFAADTGPLRKASHAAIATIGRMSASFKRRASEIAQASSGVASSFEHIGAYAGVALLGVGAAMGTLVTITRQYEDAMLRTKAISDATGDSFDAMTSKARQLGMETVFSASEAAEGLTYLSMAGLDADESVDALRDTLNLAAAAGLDLGRAADLASNVMVGFSIEAENMERVVDVLTETITSTNTNMEQLGQAMSYVAPFADAAGISLEEASASIGMMGDVGIQAGRAGRSLRRALVQLLNPVGASARAMESLGLEAETVSGEMIDVADVMEQLEDRGATAGDVMELFGARAGPGMAALLSAGSDELREFTEQLENSGGRAQNVADIQISGITGSFRMLTSALTESAIAVSTSGIIQAFEAVADSATWAVRVFNNMPEAVHTAVAGLLTVSTAALSFHTLARGIRAVTTALGVLTGFGSALAGPWAAAVVAGIGAIVFAYSRFVDATRDAAETQADFNDALDRFDGSSVDAIRFTVSRALSEVSHWGTDLDEVISGSNLSMDELADAAMRSSDALTELLAVDASDIDVFDDFEDVGFVDDLENITLDEINQFLPVYRAALEDDFEEMHGISIREAEKIRNVLDSEMEAIRDVFVEDRGRELADMGLGNIADEMTSEERRIIMGVDNIDDALLNLISNAHLVDDFDPGGVASIFEGIDDIGPAMERINDATDEDIFEMFDEDGVTNVSQFGVTLAQAGISSEKLASALGMTNAEFQEAVLLAEQSEGAFEALSDRMQSAMRNWISPLDPMSEYNSMLSDIASNTDQTIDEIEDSLDRFMQSLEETIEAQESWGENLAYVSDEFGADAAQLIADLGIEFAPLLDEAIAEGEVGRLTEMLGREASAGIESAVLTIENELGSLRQSLFDASGELSRGAANELAQQFGISEQEARSRVEEVTSTLEGALEVAEINFGPEIGGLISDLADEFEMSPQEVGQISYALESGLIGAVGQATEAVGKMDDFRLVDSAGLAIESSVNEVVDRINEMGDFDNVDEDVLANVVTRVLENSDHEFGILAREAEDNGVSVAQAIVGGLASETDEAKEVAESYVRTIRGALGQIDHALGRVRSGSSDVTSFSGRLQRRLDGVRGATVESHADGDVLPQSATIQPGRRLVQWAEPETGGEAFIPLAASKRGRSVQIWEEVGRRLGVDPEPTAMADGGFIDAPPAHNVGGELGAQLTDVMQYMYESASATADEAIEALAAAVGPQLGSAPGWESMWEALSSRFPGVALHSGYRPGAVTATGNPSYHGMGRAIDVSPSESVAEWIRQNYKANTRELIFSPLGGRQIHNGSDHTYSGVTRDMHWDHVHWAMAGGGKIEEPVYGIGADTGERYLFGEDGPEFVVPAGGMPTPPSRRSTRGLEEDDLRQMSDRIDIAYDMGLIDAAEYADILNDRLDDAESYTQEWRAAMDGIMEINKQILRDARQWADIDAGSLMDALGRMDQIAAMAPDPMLSTSVELSEELLNTQEQINDVRREMGLVDHDLWLDTLVARLARADTYSDDWLTTLREIEELQADMVMADLFVGRHDVDNVRDVVSGVSDMASLVPGLDSGFQSLAGHSSELSDEMLGVSEEFNDVRREMGLIDDELWLETLVARLGRAQEGTQEWLRIFQEIEDVFDKVEGVPGQTRDEAINNVNSQISILESMIDAEERHREDVEDARRRRDESIADARIEASEEVEAAERDHEQAINDLIADRADLYNDYVSGVERATVGERHSADAIERNIRDQTGQLREWHDGLAELRDRGLSDEALSRLRLDESPERVRQVLHMLGESDSSLRSLNDAVLRHRREAEDRAQDTVDSGVGSIGDDVRAIEEDTEQRIAEVEDSRDRVIAEARETFNETVRESEEALRESIEASERDLEDLNRDIGANVVIALREGLLSEIGSVRDVANEIREIVAEAGLELPQVARRMPSGSIGPAFEGFLPPYARTAVRASPGAEGAAAARTARSLDRLAGVLGSQTSQTHVDVKNFDSKGMDERKLARELRKMEILR